MVLSLGVTHDFDVANCSWSYGTVERMNSEDMRLSRVVLSKSTRALSEWLEDSAMASLNSAYRERMETNPL